jgi:antitoxin PrlF
MVTSKLTPRGRTTIPPPVRIALRLRKGDEIAYAVEGQSVILTKVGTAQLDDPFRGFTEWDSDADRRAYGDL